VTNTVSAYIDASAVSAAASSITVEASAQPVASADAQGMTGGTTLAVGASVATATVTPTVSATVSGQIAAGSLSIIANANLPSGDAPSAVTSAQGSVGAFLIGVVASDAESTNTATVTAGIGNQANVAAAAGTVVAVTGALLIVANSNTQQNANASNS